MDVLQCITCGQRWTHGGYPDHGGRLAHEHEQKHQQSDPKHILVVGEVGVVAEMVTKESR